MAEALKRMFDEVKGQPEFKAWLISTLEPMSVVPLSLHLSADQKLAF